MPEQFLEKVTGFLLRPVETFQKCRTDTLQSAFLYYLPLLVVYAILSTLVAMAGFDVPWFHFKFIPATEAFFPVATGIVTLLMEIVSLFVIGAFLQLGVILMGGTRGYVQTVKACMYAFTPGYLLGWIPVIGIIAMIWNLVLEVIGIRELQEISTGKSILAIVIGIVILIIIAIILAPVLAAVIFGMAGAVKSV